MSVGSLLGASGTKALVSAGSVSLVNYYRARSNGRTPSLLSLPSLKRAAYQGISSFASGSIEAAIKPLLPPAAQISSMYLQPLLTAGSYTLLAKFVDGSESYVANFLISLGSEVAAGCITTPLTGLLMPSSSNYIQGMRSNILG